MNIAAFAFLSLIGLSTLSAEAGPNLPSTDLAAGYTAAFQCMNKSTATITYTNADQVEVIKDIKEVKPFGAALLIKNITGTQQILDAERIVKISE